MTTQVWLDGRAIRVAPSALIAQGGEAEIYDLGDGRVLKLFKPAGHPDFAGDPAAGAAAGARIAEHQRKLPAFPTSLPAAVVVPTALATRARRSTEIVGYAMPRVAGEPLHHLGEVRWRRDRGVDLDAVVAALGELHATVTELHRRGIVIGDFNDLNVLVDAPRVRVIDADSFQLPGYRCALYSHRFVDPRLCDVAGGAPVLVRPHDTDSDWFAFAIMAFRSLLGVSPYGGVHRPSDRRRAVAAGARSLRGISVFDRDVVYPRAALPWSVLPDDLIAAFRDVFVAGRRGAFPRRVLDGLRFHRCATCGLEHARTPCPVCAASVPVAIAITGALRVTEIAVADVAPATFAVGSSPDARVWLAGDTLRRAGALGPEAIGSVLSGQTRAWVGARLGVGFYRAGGMTVGFVFRPDRRGLDDRVALPAIRGVLVAASATIADDRAWLAWTTAHAGRLATTIVAIASDGRILGTHTSDGADWAAGIAGACAAGDLLFVPTDDGVVRVEVVAGTLAVTRAFSDTAAVVAAGDVLHLAPRGLDAVRGGRARRLHLS